MTLSKLLVVVVALTLAGTTFAVELPGARTTLKATARAAAAAQAVATVQAAEKVARTGAEKRTRIHADNNRRATAAS